MGRFLTVSSLVGALWMLHKVSKYFGSELLAQFDIGIAFLVATVVYVIFGGYHTLWVMYKTLPRDLRYICL